jgi:hypothetical protein
MTATSSITIRRACRRACRGEVEAIVHYDFDTACRFAIPAALAAIAKRVLPFVPVNAR